MRTLGLPDQRPRLRAHHGPARERGTSRPSSSLIWWCSTPAAVRRVRTTSSTDGWASSLG
ncbi:hypothetical protein QJS66_06530 [Kocuria rhizophila]|nr:hypothetical protein QJS66_06530 [Kocuria rhizophila]